MREIKNEYESLAFHSLRKRNIWPVYNFSIYGKARIGTLMLLFFTSHLQTAKIH